LWPPVDPALDPFAALGFHGWALGDVMIILLVSLAAAQMAAGLIVIFWAHDFDETIGVVAFGMGSLTLGAAAAVKHLAAIRSDQRRIADAIVSMWHGRRPKLDLIHKDLL
jgi:hypothetical protein